MTNVLFNDLMSDLSPEGSDTQLWTFDYETDGGYSQDAAVGQPILITDPLENVWNARYDTRGNLTKVWDPVGSESTNYTSAEYDLGDRLIKIESPPTGTSGSGRSKTEPTYLYSTDYSGTVMRYGPAIGATASNESGTAIRASFATFGKEGEPLKSGSIVSSTQKTESELVYDGAYRVKQFKDGLGQATTNFFDLNSRLTETRLPGYDDSPRHDWIEYTSYDLAGRLRAMTDGNGTEWEYTYDDADGLLSEMSAPLLTTGFEYDPYGRVVAMTDSLGGETYAYDDLGLLLSKTRSYTGLDDQETEFTYNDDGSRSTAVGPMGTYTYFYDDNYRLNKFTSNAGAVEYEYFDDGSLSKRSVKNGSNALISETNYAYNEVGALESLTNKDGSSNTRSSFGSFTFDGVFNLTGLSRTITGVSGLSGTASFGYDAQDRLTSETTPGFSSTTHAYDDAYNPTTMRGTGSIAYNSNNQRTTGSFAYDGNGNATTFKGDDCYYDYANRLTVYEPYHTGTNPYYNVGYMYGGDGLMGKRAKHVYNYTGGHWTEAAGNPTYIYNLDGHPTTEYTESIEEEGDPTVNLNIFAPDGLVARKQSGNWIYYQFDQQGNVCQRLNSSGTVLNSSSYDAYGNQALNGSSQNDPWAYNAQWGYVRDVDTSLYYCQNRWYDPTIGRWLNRDPIGYAGGANLYGYCDGQVIGWIDEDGLRKRAILFRGELSAGEFLGAELVETLFLEAVAEQLRDQGYEVTILNEPTSKTLAKSIHSKDVEVVVGVFHGRSEYGRLRGDPATGDTIEKLTPHTILAGRGGLPKLKGLVLVGCNALKSAAQRRKYLLTTEALGGYDTSVTIYPWGVNPQPKWFSSP